MYMLKKNAMNIPGTSAALVICLLTSVGIVSAAESKTSALMSKPLLEQDKKPVVENNLPMRLKENMLNNTRDNSVTGKLNVADDVLKNKQSTPNVSKNAKNTKPPINNSTHKNPPGIKSNSHKNLSALSNNINFSGVDYVARSTKPSPDRVGYTSGKRVPGGVKLDNIDYIAKIIRR